MELGRRFATESACREYLAALRWPEGFVCPRCQGRENLVVRRGLWRCLGCRREVSVAAGTIFQDSKLPLTVWFQVMWHLTVQKNGISAVGLQRMLGFGSYKTAWTVLHKLRRAMVRPGRDRLKGVVEVDDTTWGGFEEGTRGRRIGKRALIIVAAEAEGSRIGRIRLRHIPDLSRETLHGFIVDMIEPGSTVKTDGLNAYRQLHGFVHDWQVQRRHVDYLMPRVHRVISLLKRWLLGTHQGAIDSDYLQDYFDEFTFRFNRRTSASRGKLFYRLAQQAVQVAPTTYDALGKHNL